jgi:hypothetical protein
MVRGSDTHYCSGNDIRVGDQVHCANWSGVVMFVLGTGSFASGYDPADWLHLGSGFMVEYGRVGLVFSEQADEDLVLVARAKPAAAAEEGA